jgi:hypothetical protein
MKKWDSGLQQFVIVCNGCKNEIIEDEILWFIKDGKEYCENCADEMGLKDDDKS